MKGQQLQISGDIFGHCLSVRAVSPARPRREEKSLKGSENSV